MKYLHKLFGSYVVFILALGLCYMGNLPLYAQPQVTAESVPSNSTPANGATITVDVNIDMTGSPAPDDKLGSFTGTLNWAATVLRYVSHAGPKAGFTGVVDTSKARLEGKLTFNGANPNGASGKSNVLTITYRVIGTNGSSTVLDLAFSAMSAAGSFKNLLPILTVTDGTVTVGGSQQCDPQNCSGAAVFPAPRNIANVGELIEGRAGDTVYVDIRLKGNPQPIRTFGFNVQVDPNHLDFVSAQAGNLTTGWLFLNGNESPAGSGTIICGGANVSPIPANSAGVLIRLSFVVTCQEDGDTSEITINALLDDIVGFSACCNIFQCVVCVQDGDVDGDGSLASEDASCAFEIFLGGGVPSPSCDFPDFDCEVIAADPDCDGFVTPFDALVIYERFLAGDDPAECFAQTHLAKRQAKAQPYQLFLSQRTERRRGERSDQEILKVALTVDHPTRVELSTFGLKLSYSADKLEVLSVQRTALTAEWLKLDGRANQPGTLVIGGFTPTPLVMTAPAELLQIIFATKGKAIHPADIVVSELVGEFANAMVKGAEVVALMPQAFKLHQSYPNPLQASASHAQGAGSETVIRFDLPGPQEVKVELAIYNLTGQLVRHLVSETRVPGAYAVTWNGLDEQGRQLPSGTYLYRIKAGNFVETKRLTIIR